jgi:predicted transcriptional regulator
MSDIPLAEITLRKYESPYQLGKRELAKKICLSLGLLQTADNRDVIVDILLVLIEAQKKKEVLLGQLNEPNLDYNLITSISEDLSKVNLALETAETRWLELSEKAIG